MITKRKILVVDDDYEIRRAISMLLAREDYQIVEAKDGIEALEIIDDDFDLVILDVMMPQKDGIETCEEIREMYSMPILFLTAKSTEYDKYKGFLAGGDDYISKPFSSIELLARVAAMIRRYNVYRGKRKEPDENKIIINEMVIDLDNSKAYIGKEELKLTNTEYRILVLLAENPNKVFTIEEIYEEIWRERYVFSVNGTVMVHIKNLRNKIEEISKCKFVKNVWGKGYCIEKIGT